MNVPCMAMVILALLLAPAAWAQSPSALLDACEVAPMDREGPCTTALYGRGLARIAKGQAGAGQADIATARALRPAVEEEYRRLGLAPR